MRKDQGITLLALVVTIIVLIVLAAVSINAITSDNGLIKKSQEAKFKLEASSYKEKAYVKLGSKSQQVIKSSDIYTLRENFKGQIQTINKGSCNAEDGISMILTAEVALNEVHSMLQRMKELMTQYQNYYSDDESAIREEMEQFKEEINRVAATTKFNDRKLLDGSYDIIIDVGSVPYEQGSIGVSIDSMDWKGIYGADEIYYSNTEEAVEKIQKAIDKVADQRARLGSKQNRLEHTVAYLDNLGENLLTLMASIYGDFDYSANPGTKYDPSIPKTEGEIQILNELSTGLSDGISLVQTAEGSLSETHSILQRMIELMTMYINNNIDSDQSSAIKDEMEQLKSEVDRIANTTTYNEMKLLDGTFEATIQLGMTPEDGNLILSINPMDWKSIYGSEQIDYTISQTSLDKINNAISKVTLERSKLGARQNRMEHSISLLDTLAEMKQNSLSSSEDGSSSSTGGSYDYSTGTFDKEIAIRIANSWNTTIGFIQISEGTLAEIHKMLQRINVLAVQATSGTNNEKDRKYIQYEIDEYVDEINRELKHCVAIDRNLLQGDLPFFDKIDTVSLKISNLSVMTRNDARKAEDIVGKAIDYISNIRQIISNNQTKILGLGDIKTIRADQGHAFDVVDSDKKNEQTDDIDNKNTIINDKFRIQDGVLYYTGTDEQERKWAQELDISIMFTK